MNAYITILGYWTTIVIAYVIITVNIFIFKKKKSDVVTVTWKSFVMLFVTLLLSPTIVIVILIIIVYRQLINQILRFTIDENYGGLLNGGDVVHVLENVNESKIKILFIVDYEKNNGNSFYSFVKEKIYTSKLMKCPKTRAVFRKSYGYYYYVKNQVNIEDCFKQITLPNKNTKTEELMQFIESTENIPLPGNNFGLWDVFVGTHPINWNSEVPNKTYYPILLRFHHSMSDGYHIITTIFGNFSDAKMVNKKSLKFKKNTNNAFQKMYVFLRQLFEMILFPWRLFLIVNANNFDTLSKVKLQKKKIFNFCSDKNKRYVQIVKEIKKHFCDVSFTDIVLAAISSSFSKHTLKSLPTTSNYIPIATPEVPRATELLHTQYQDNESSLTCKNEVSFSLRKLPIHKNISMLQRLNLVKNQGGFLSSSYQIMADYYITNFLFTTFPNIIVKKALKLSPVTAFITNLPGPPKTKCLSGNSLEDMISWSISKSTTNTGISIAIVTYDNRLQISLSTDVAVISTKHEINNMLSNIYTSLDELHQQICKTNKVVVEKS